MAIDNGPGGVQPPIDFDQALDALKRIKAQVSMLRSKSELIDEVLAAAEALHALLQLPSGGEGTAKYTLALDRFMKAGEAWRAAGSPRIAPYVELVRPFTSHVPRADHATLTLPCRRCKGPVEKWYMYECRACLEKTA